MSERAQDFQGNAKAAPPPPRVIRRGEPYTPTESHVPELVEAAKAEQRRSASVQQFLDRQKAAHEARVKRGPPFAAPTWPTLPREDDAQKDAAAAREVLAVAIQRRVAAETDLHHVGEAVRRQQAVVDAADAEAEKWAGADAEVHRYIADHAGEEVALPDGLLVKRSRRDAATSALVDARGALALLEADRHRAQVALDAIKARVGEAVAGVKTAVMVVAAVAMADHQKRAFVLRRTILAARDTQVDGHTYPLAPAIEIALREPAEPWQTIPMADRKTYHGMWAHTVAALMADPDAELKL